MAEYRFSALRQAINRPLPPVTTSGERVSETFASKVFTFSVMEKYLSRDTYAAVRRAVDEGGVADMSIADQVATGLKAWAIENGATHYTHWFHPLTDTTAEKHDAFIESCDKGRLLESFPGNLLIQQEPDASSFPSGGIRNTFEARGYTAWDVSSPAFIVGTTLCIPTVFVSYTGEALDYKAPLLKALGALDTVAAEVCRYFDKDVKRVVATLGIEQEYFLIDEALYHARPDLVLADRTLMGHQSAKDQQLSDHYFGSIPERVMTFMREFEQEAYRLGIPVKTRHNEVSPNQFECAPLFEEANLAIDHNQLLMETMKRVARRHRYRVLFHEKPFAGVNGSGKHCNWSLHTDTGVNLLAPGHNPKTNLQFITFLVNVLKCVNDNQDLLLASVMSATNACRLGGHEAPPSVMSVFLGDYLSDMLDNIARKVTDRKMSPSLKTELKLGIGKIPGILLDNTDRNRTSPFAFTGNRFEYRAVGSSANCSAPVIALCTALAAQLTRFRDEVEPLIAKGRKRDEAILHVLKHYIADSGRICFNGDGYSEEWHKEAVRRGLYSGSGVPETVSRYLSPRSVQLFTSMGVLTEKELISRTEVEFEKFVKKVQIEARVLGDVAINHIVPVAVRYMTVLSDNVRGLKELFPSGEYERLAGARKDLIVEISDHITMIKKLTAQMIQERKRANVIESMYERAVAYENMVKPFLSDIRYHIDKLEMVVDNSMWPFPKYRELLFTR